MMEKAYKDYPIGTKYIDAACLEGIETVEQQNFTYISSDCIWGELAKGCLFYNGAWAEIITNTYNIY